MTVKGNQDCVLSFQCCFCSKILEQLEVEIKNKQKIKHGIELSSLQHVLNFYSKMSLYV